MCRLFGPQLHWTGLAFTLACSTLAAAQAKSSIHLNKDAVIASCGSEGTRSGAEDVQDLTNDMTAVFGVAPKIAHQAGTAKTEIVIDFDGSLNPAAKKGKTKSFALRAMSTESGTSQIVLTGADMRGTMDAIYTFSERIPGVDPMHFWTHKLPPEARFHRRARGLQAERSRTALSFPGLLHQR